MIIQRNRGACDIDEHVVVNRNPPRCLNERLPRISVNHVAIDLVEVVGDAYRLDGASRSPGSCWLSMATSSSYVKGLQRLAVKP